MVRDGLDMQGAAGRQRRDNIVAGAHDAGGLRDGEKGVQDRGLVERVRRLGLLVLLPLHLHRCIVRLGLDPGLRIRIGFGIGRGGGRH